MNRNLTSTEKVNGTWKGELRGLRQQKIRFSGRRFYWIGRKTAHDAANRIHELF